MNKMKSIRTLFIAITVIITVAIFTAQAMISYFSFSSISIEAVENNLKTQAEKEAAIMNAKLTGVGKASSGLAGMVASMSTIDDQTLFNVIGDQMKKDSMIYGGGFWMEPYMGDSTKKYYGPYVYLDGGNPVVTWDYNTDEYDYFQYDWYKDGLTADGGVVFSEPYLDAVTNVAMITASAQINKNGKVVGVTTFDIGLDEMENHIENIKVGKKGYAFVVTQHGYYWATKDVEKDLTVKIAEDKNTGIKDFGKKLINDTKTGIYVVDDGKHKDYMVYTPVGDTGLKLVTVMPESEATAAVNKVLMIYIAVFVVSIALFIMAITFLFNKKIIGPLNAWKKSSEMLSVGDVSENVELAKYKDDNNEIGLLSRVFIELSQSIKEKAEFAEKVADGDLTVRIEPKSDRDILAISMDKIVDSLNSLVGEAQILTQAAMKGELYTRGNEDKFHGGYKQIIEGFNSTLNGIIRPLDSAMLFIGKVANGEQLVRDDETRYEGKFAELKKYLEMVGESLYTMLDEVSKLTSETADGNLSYRADTSKLKGNYATLVKGINESLDRVIDPLNVAASYMEKIGQGEIPEKITEQYKGDFDDIKNSINKCIEGLGALEEGREVMHNMSLNDYTVKMEGNYLGIYGDIKDSVNNIHIRLNRIVEVLTHVSNGDLSDLEGLVAIGKRSEHDTLIPALIGMITGVQSLVEETDMLSKAAVEGKLSTRGDVGKFNGEYAKVVEGINNTLDAVIEPVMEANGVLNELADGNLRVQVKGDYRGDHAAIKNALNTTISNLLGYIENISQVLSQIASGNLGMTVTAEYKGDFAQIKDSLNNIITTMNEVMGNIRESAEQVSVGSRQVSEGSQTLSQGATEQASSIEELTASVSEVASKTRANAENAGTANELALNVRDSAEMGTQHMRDMLNAMGEINESSSNISRIIKVIDDIAFQTNILALNAAVEAARAGSHGKGFAVVAEEVRNLASRSAAAVKETTELIQGSMKKVTAGTVIANDTASALDDIVNGIGRTTDLIAEIAVSSNEQASGIAQINTGLNQVSMVVQNNAATAEESAASSEELSGQAEMLKEMVGRFKLTTDSRGQKASVIKQSEKQVSKVQKPRIDLGDNVIDKY